MFWQNWYNCENLKDKRGIGWKGKSKWTARSRNLIISNSSLFYSTPSLPLSQNTSSFISLLFSSSFLLLLLLILFSSSFFLLNTQLFFIYSSQFSSLCSVFLVNYSNFFSSSNKKSSEIFLSLRYQSSITLYSGCALK